MIVTMKNVHKAFGPTEVLKGIDLEVDQGEVVAIIGASGSGKSTILRIVNNLETADKGQVWVCEVPVHDPKLAHKVHGRVGMVFQQFNLFPHLDAAENVMLALKRVKKMSKAEAESVAKEVLGKVGMADHWSKYPIQLSGGQQQRVAIARSLALEPRLMLFDEATSALDPELVGEVTGVMRQLAKDGMSMMIVTHEMRFAREIADRVLFIDKGIIVEQGPPSAVFGSPQNERTQRFLSSVFNI
ncbi:MULTISPECIES: amino acid ABC transporter ATP-binding protein [unclassified Mesorhizobium]|uniref:amino acid ABC transporter ATP-binding protein n=1 Tax=unclassified Mesorhizobium TaxID=325217 RepID=UPI000FD90E4E|nr:MULTISPECIES: amino acid ABC transporter ATP-binding protein [unclassified Mesorhizobium]TGT71890.1 amino acid ABC transporter ATP-binding protein [Mesorhizobium sp. M2E.F.Ca.ET.166.01.1.1]TGV99395.1 amino acid ABC transporter ATP-binding protein [Mesorhizobium sp. M2E.F.Ca.ET.154.01.1.1]